jgi:hypothetical protein
MKQLFHFTKQNKILDKQITFYDVNIVMKETLQVSR